MSSMGDRQPQPGETERGRLVRNLQEILQELRVAQAGVQILFAFLLAVAFTPRFGQTTVVQRGVYLVTVMLTTASAVLLIAPVAWHRILFRRGRRERIVEVANRYALAGLGFLAAAMTGTVLLVADVVFGDWVALGLAAAAGLLFALYWCALPLRERRRSPPSPPLG
jgi:Family of unknown function (DUF6328)